MLGHATSAMARRYAGQALNRQGAALRGVNPDFTASLAWVIGGALAAAAGILLAGSSELDPYTISLGVLPAFVAALIGGLAYIWLKIASPHSTATASKVSIWRYIVTIGPQDCAKALRSATFRQANAPCARRRRRPGATWSRLATSEAGCC